MATPTTEKPETSLHGPNLILDVENFGPIAEAKNIEFKPMTVLVGPSNTGKTYLATLIHALLRTEQRISLYDVVADNEDRGFGDVFDDPRYDDFFQAVYEPINDLAEDPELRSRYTEIPIAISNLKRSAQEFLGDVVNRFLLYYATGAATNISAYFDVSNVDALGLRIGRYRSPPKISVRGEGLTLELTDCTSPVKKYTVPESIEISIDIDDEIRHSPDVVEELIESVDLGFELGFFGASPIRYFPLSHYFRAGRTGLVDAYRELAANLIARATSAPREKRRARALSVSYSTGEFLEALVSLRPESSSRIRYQHIAKIADVLERAVLGGNIKVKETGGVSYFEFDKDGVAIPLDRASSMVTELAPIVLFIRRFVSFRDLLIIDEPEAHLHPEAQQQMAAALAFMVRSGLRVLITTHSHYMVEQLSAFVNASKLDEPARKRALFLGGALGEEDIYLNEDETAVYGFDQSNSEGGTVVYEIPLGEHREYAPRDHSKAVNRQYNRLQRVLEARERLGV